MFTLAVTVVMLLCNDVLPSSTPGSLVLSSSLTPATKGDNFTLICTSNTTVGDRYTIQWYRSGNLLFKTTYNPSQSCELSEVNQILYRPMYMGRTTVSCDDFQHNVTVRIKPSYDYGTFWVCNDIVRRQTSNTITIKQPSVQSMTTSSFPPNSTVPTTSAVKQQTSTVAPTSAVPTTLTVPTTSTVPPTSTVTPTSTVPTTLTVPTTATVPPASTVTPTSTVPTTSTVPPASTATPTSTVPSTSTAPQAITTPSSTTLTVSSTSNISATPFATTFSTITTSATTVSAFEVQNLGLEGVVHIVVGSAAVVLVIIVIAVVVVYIRRRRHPTEVEAKAETSTYENLTETPPVSYESIRVSPYQNSGAQYNDPGNYINIHVK